MINMENVIIDYYCARCYIEIDYGRFCEKCLRKVKITESKGGTKK